MAKSSKRKDGPSDNSSSRSNNDNDNTGSSKVKRARKSIPRSSPQKRSSIYRGVTRHRWTGRYEAHLWDKNCWNESQNKKGRQVYLGAYDDEQAAAHAYDLAALKYWGQDTNINFPLSTYQNELKEMEGQTKEEYIGSLRRKSSGFSRGVSKYRGVARHHHNGRWEARIGRVLGNKYLYLGTYATQEEAAAAYDMAAIEYRGPNAVTNFDISRYMKWLQPSKENSNESMSVAGCTNDNQNLNQETFHLDLYPDPNSDLQSSKLKKIPEETTYSDSPSSQLDPDPDPDPDPEPPKSCFPDDIQTSFDFHDSSSFDLEYDIIYGDFDYFLSPIFESEFDAQ